MVYIPYRESSLNMTLHVVMWDRDGRQDGVLPKRSVDELWGDFHFDYRRNRFVALSQIIFQGRLDMQDG